MSMKSILCALLAVGLSVSAAYAEPSVKRSGSSITVNESLTDDGISQVKELAGQIKTPTFKLQNIKDADLVKFCQAFPNVASLYIKAKEGELASIAPVAGLKNLTSFEMEAESVKDLSPLAGLTKLTELDVTCPNMGPDLKWMSGMTSLTKVAIFGGSFLTSLEGFPALQGNPRISIGGAAIADLSPIQNLPSSRFELLECTIQDLSPLAKMPKLTDLSLYGSSVKDFSPLANCAKLKSLTYYAVKDADFSTLKALKQVTELKGGLTDLDNISFVSELPALRTFEVFAEYVTDYSPLGSSTVEKLQIWSMNAPCDLSGVGKAKTLKELKLWSVDDATNSAALAGLTELEKFTITSNYNENSGQPFDMASAKGWGKLKEMSITDAKVINTKDNMGALTSLQRLTLNEVNKEGEPFSLAGLTKLANLESVSINKSQVTDFEGLSGCTGLVYIEMKNTKGVTSLAPLKALPNLKRIVVSKGAFPDSELSGFAETVKIEQR